MYLYTSAIQNKYSSVVTGFVCLLETYFIYVF